MSSYIKILAEALKKHDVIRKTEFNKALEALYIGDECIYSTADEAFEADLVETIKPEPELVLFGAGHVAKAVYDIAVLLGFSVTVFDERAELLSEERFPLARRIAKPYEEIYKEEYDFLRPYYLIFTHGHKYDKASLRYALNHDASYRGMIGSRGKVRATLDSLKEEGFSEELLSTVYSPIGLKIGAVTPEEIAVSIIAEIISVYRKDKNMITLSPDYLNAIKDEEGVAVRIVEKSGSAPRAVGSEIMITKSGRLIGTVGGGAIEKVAIEEARKMIRGEEKTPLLKHYALNPSGDLGMICGGEVTLLYTKR